MAVVDPNQHDQFVLRQRIRPVINHYEFSLADDEPPFCFVEQARFKFKEDIRFFADDSKSVELMRIKARQRFDPRATYDVTGPDGTRIGEIQQGVRQEPASARRTRSATGRARSARASRTSSWRSSVAWWGWSRSSGDFADWLPIPYHFTLERDGAVIGTHKRRIGKFRDTYDIDVSGDAERSADRRVVLALAVGMDALQAR